LIPCPSEAYLPLGEWPRRFWGDYSEVGNRNKLNWPQTKERGDGRLIHKRIIFRILLCWAYRSRFGQHESPAPDLLGVTGHDADDDVPFRKFKVPLRLIFFKTGDAGPPKRVTESLPLTTSIYRPLNFVVRHGIDFSSRFCLSGLGLLPRGGISNPNAVATVSGFSPLPRTMGAASSPGTHHLWFGVRFFLIEIFFVSHPVA